MKRILARRDKYRSGFYQERKDLSPNVPEEQNSFGLKALVEGIKPTFDIIAIHGLNGHRERTWTAKNGILWLRDLLPRVIPNARIITYGYDSRTHSTDPLTYQTLYGHATMLVTTMTTFRQTSKTCNRPIIFLAHSLGGLVVKSALIHSDSCREGHLKGQKAIKSSTHGILFFGTPHQGGNGVGIGQIVLRIASIGLNTSERVMKHLENNSEWLETQLGQYSAISQDFETLMLYEAYPTPSPVGSKIVVPKASAALQGIKNVEAVEIRKNHHTMVKFEVDSDPDYQIVSSKIVLMSQAAHRNAKDTIDFSIDSFCLPIELPSGRNHNFTGREDILRQIHEKFTESCENTGKVVALHGTGGLGKTQIALEYAYSQGSRYSTIVWIDGQSLSTTTSSVIAFVQRLLDHYANASGSSVPDYLETARCLHVGGMVDRSGRLDCQRQLHRLVEAAKHWLQQKWNDNWLMICDNVDDLESFNISHYWPNSSHRKVLITSRRPESIRFGDGIALPQMQHTESFTLFAKSLGMKMKAMKPTEIEESRKIIEKLGCLPLAIDQAGAYIQRLSMPLRSYLPLFDRNFRQVMDRRPPKALWRYREDTVLTTWEVSYGAVINQCPEAAEILVISSFFSNQNIPENLLEHSVQASDCTVVALSSKKSSRIVELIPLGLLVSEAIATLSSFSLVERTHSAASFSIHPLIHTWTRERCTIDERRSFALKATQGLGVALGKLELNTFSSWAQRRQILPHVQVLNEWAKELFFKDLFELSTEDADHFYLIGCEFMRDEQYASAFPWLSKALECQESKHGKDHSTTLTTVHQLGSLFFYQENIAQASIYYERAYLGRKTLYGTEHSLTLVSLEGLALVYSKKGDEGKCLELHEEVLAARHRALGNLHEDTLYSWFLVGLSLARLERPEEALEMVMRAFVGFQKTFGQDHPKTLQTARYVGWVFLFMRNCEESLRYYRLALAGQEHHLGKDHSETLSCAFGVGMVHQYQSEFGVALNYYVRVLVGREALFGEDFHSVMEVVEKIAEVQRQSSQYDDAVNSYLRLLRSRQAILGVDHLDSLNVVEKVADTYMDANRFDDALEWYQRLATAFQRLKGSLDVKTLTSQRLKESLDLKTLTIKSDMAYYLFRLENYTEAITAYQEVLEVYAMLPQAKQAYFYGVTLDLAEIYYNDRQYPKALDYSQRAFDFYAEHLTEDYPIVLAFFYLGRSAAKTMKWKTAISKCIDILEKLGPPKENNLKPKQVLSAIALVLQAIGKVLLLSKNEETAAKCYVLVMKYWMASGNRGGHAAICDGCEMRGGDLESIEGTRYICRTCEDTDLCQRCMLEYDRRAFDVPSCRNHPFFAVAPLSAAAQDIGTTIEEQIALFTNELNGMQQELLALESNECKPREA